MPRRRRRDLTLAERIEERLAYAEEKRKKREGEFVPTPVSDKIKKESIALWGPYCFFCGYSPEKGEYLEFDHWEPEALGGENNAENIRPVCSRHHSAIGRKRGRDPLFDLDAGFYEILNMPELENEPPYSSLYLADAQLG